MNFLKLFFAIIIDVIDAIIGVSEALVAGVPVGVAWNTIQLLLIMVIAPTGFSLVAGIIDYLPGISAFIPAATISVILGG